MNVLRQQRLRKALGNLNRAMGVVSFGLVGVVFSIYLGALFVAPLVFLIVNGLGYDADSCVQSAGFFGPFASLPLCFIGAYSFVVLIPWLRSEISQRPFAAATTFGLVVLMVGCVLLIAEYSDPSRCWSS